MGGGPLLAFLVDGDNASASYVKSLLDESAKYGTVSIRRVYGDWTSTQLSSWKKVVQEHALTPFQQFANVSGKNATDSALIIDAMDILHREVVSGFCIVSSDSDYTRLATRIRESGRFIIGMGRSSTPVAFRNACNVFVSIENLAPDAETGEPQAERAPPLAQGTFSPRPTDWSPPLASPHARAPLQDALPVLRRAFDTTVGDTGRIHLAELGVALLKLDPAFDSRTYGRARLAYLIESFPEQFVLERRPERGTGVVYVRLKDSQPSPH